MDKCFLHGTQKRFKKEIIVNGVQKENSAVFLLEFPLDKEKLLFTTKIALYHAISLEVQKRILEKNYSSFYQFYEKNPEYLPLLFLLNGDNFTGYEKSFYKHALDEKLLTYGYLKVVQIGRLSKIVKFIEVTLQDILIAEEKIGGKVQSGANRFFEKVEKQKITELWNKFLISNEYMENLCTQLTKILDSRIQFFK